MYLQTKSRLSVILTIVVMLWGMWLHYADQQLDCSSWPLCYEKESFRPFVDTSMVYFHRLFGLLLGLLFLSLAWSLKKAGSSLFVEAVLILAYLGIQGGIGAFSAVHKMPSVMRATHFLFSLWTLRSVVRFDHLVGIEHDPPVRIYPLPAWIKDVFFVGTIVLVVQIVFGSLIKHTGAAEVCGTGENLAPFCRGPFAGALGWWPSMPAAKLHMFHRFGALAAGFSNLCLSAVGLWAALRCKLPSFEGRHLLFSSLLLALLTLLQIYSGIFALYRHFPALVGVTHGLFAVVMFAVVFKLHFSFWRADPRPTTLSDIVDLAKPGLALLVMLTVAVGILAAPGTIDPMGAFAAFVFVFFAVAGGGILNCCMERDIDRLMERTKTRALPAGRMDVRTALVVGLSLVLLSLIGLYSAVNSTTALLAFAALVLYLLCYTPLKRKSPAAVWVGAIPGAIPPLMGFSAMAGGIDATALCLFAILFWWQIPHFLAISVYRIEEYRRAGIMVYPHVMGFRALCTFTTATTLVLVAATLAPLLLGKSGAYIPVCATAGAMFLAVALWGFIVGRSEEGRRTWARVFFYASLLYLPIVLGAFLFF